MNRKQEIVEHYTDSNLIYGKENLYNFMNHGYSPPYKFLKNYHKIFRHSASLYINLLENINVEKKDLLDIGCGRGGGVDVYRQYFPFSRIVACDITPAQINHCKQNIKNVEFHIMDADDLKFENHSFDIITNVESSHHYANKPTFFNKVYHLLKPNGVFLYTDGFPPGVSLPDDILPFKRVIKTEITSNVKKALKKEFKIFRKHLKDNEAKNFLINNTITKYVDYTFNDLKYYKYVCYK